MNVLLGSSEKIEIIRLMSKSLKKSFASLIKFAVAFWIASKKDKSDKLMQMALVVKRNSSPISHQQHGINLSGKMPLG